MCTQGVQVSIVQIYLRSYSIYFQRLSKLTQLFFARGTSTMIVAWTPSHLHCWARTKVRTEVPANECVNNKLTTYVGVSSALLPAPGFQMPPPPPLPCDLDTARDKQIAVEGTQIKGKAKKGVSLVGTEASTSADDVPVGLAPKRRGRPPGSKNKPKV